MEANEDRSASAIPKYLVYATMFFVILRIVLFGLESHIPIHHSSKTATKAITWLDLNNYISERSKTNPKNLEVKENQEFIVEEVKKIGAERPTAYGKLLLLAFLSPDSSPCKSMEDNALSNSQVTDVVKKNYLPIRVNYKKTSGLDPTLVKAFMEFRRHYRVCAFPTLVVVDKNGELVSNLVGNCSSLTTYRFLTRTMASK